MATLTATGSLLASLRPLLPAAFRPMTQMTRTLFLPALAFPVLPRLPTLDSIWESILRAVPKKKTSHMKKRHRQMAGKALKDVTALNKCPACGNTKRAHLLCPHCVASMSVNEVVVQS